MLAAARRLFVERGYAATSVAQIASGAGLSDRTVFAAFESKAKLLKAVVDAAVVGDADEVALHDRPGMRRFHEATTFEEAVERLADVFAEVAERTDEVVTVLRGAAAVDPEIARLEAELDEQRLTGVGHMAATFARLAGTTDPGEVAGIRDTLWIIGAPQQYGLVRQRGWSVARYRDWTARALAALVPERA